MNAPSGSPVDLASERAPATRIISVDALRGFIMFWIVGGDALAYAFRKASSGKVSQFFSSQLSHSKWAGVTFYDLIFPLFIFIVGVSVALSLPRTIQRCGKAGTVRRIASRSVILFLIGIVIYGGLANGWDRVRWLGVLQRIAICYFFSAALFSLTKQRGRIIVIAVLLLGYWAALTFVPIRDFNIEKQHLREACENAGTTDAKSLFYATDRTVTGHYEDGLNLTQHVDFQYLPGRKWDGAYDPEGLLSTLPAIATCLLGVLAGCLLQAEHVAPQKKVYALLVAGAAGILLGYAWGVQFPVIKKIWTSSYVLVAGGYSCLFLAAFYQFVEIWGHQQWCTPFLWIGVNPIAVYLVYHLVDFRALADKIVGGPVKAVFGTWAEMLVSATVIFLVLALARLLYHRKVFLRI